ncbi:MAG: hypothetical protein JWP57_2243 [Spirosoma sp.]|nr:hypothetical protein [Spirosoma sp.]
MKRFSVIYLLREQYHHIACNTRSEAFDVLRKLQLDIKRTPVGVYDAKTELFEWEPTRQHTYNGANIQEQSKLADQIITIAQALRHRDADRVPSLNRPSFFA